MKQLLSTLTVVLFLAFGMNLYQDYEINKISTEVINIHYVNFDNCTAPIYKTVDGYEMMSQPVCN